MSSSRVPKDEYGIWFTHWIKRDSTPIFKITEGILRVYIIHACCRFGFKSFDIWICELSYIYIGLSTLSVYCMTCLLVIRAKVKGCSYTSFTITIPKVITRGGGLYIKVDLVYLTQLWPFQKRIWIRYLCCFKEIGFTSLFYMLENIEREFSFSSSKIRSFNWERLSGSSIQPFVNQSRLLSEKFSKGTMM